MNCYVTFTKAYPFIIGLIFSLFVVENTLVTVLITYLKEEWTNLGLQGAIQIVTWREGVTKVVEFFIYVLEEKICNFLAVLGLTGLYLAGLVMLVALDPQEMKNVKELQVAVFLISLGIAGSKSLESFVKDQLKEKERVNKELAERSAQVWWYFPYILAACLAPFLVASWDFYQIILTSTLFVELMGFWSGKPLDAYAFEYRTAKSAAMKIFNIVRAAILKKHLCCLDKSQDFYENTKHYMHRLPPDVWYLRWLDRAAIIDLSMSQEEQVHKKLLYKVEEVEEVKFVLWPFAYSVTLLFYSLGEAAVTTFYLDQAQKINYEFPVITFLIFTQVSSFMTNIALDSYSNDRENCTNSPESLNLCPIIRRNKLIISIGIVLSLVSSLCALVVEVYQVHMFNISVWWLTPQFVFWGVGEGFVENGIDGLTKTLVSESMGVFGSNFRQLMIGLGRFLTLLLVSRREIYTLPFGRVYYFGFLGFLGFGNAAFTYKFVPKIIQPNQILQGPPSPQKKPPPPSPSSPPPRPLPPCNKTDEPCCCELPPVYICPICSVVISDGQCTTNCHIEVCPSWVPIVHDCTTSTYLYIVSDF